MFHPDELRDHDGRWTIAGLLEHGIEVKGTHVSVGGHKVGQVTRAAGGYQAMLSSRKLAPGPRRHATVAQAAAHVAAAHMTGGPKKLPWRNPPQPTGKPGERKGGGLTAVGITNTSLGDAVERALASEMAFKDAHPGKRQGRFDVLYGNNAYEVKAVSQSAREYKAKPKAHEVQEKLAFAKQNGLKPHVMIVVYEPGKRQIHVYSKAGVGAYRLTGPEAGWHYHGSVPINLGSGWDPASRHGGRHGLVAAALATLLAT